MLKQPLTISRKIAMTSPRITTLSAALDLLTVALFAYLGCANEARAASCLDFSATPFRIKIYNNSSNYNIFPVVTTPTNGPDEWLQGGFQVPTADIATRTYGHDYTYRFYIKPVVGIAQGGSVTLSLPLCTQLVGNPGNGSAKDDGSIGGMVAVFLSTPMLPPTASGHRRHWRRIWPPIIKTAL